MPLLLLGVRKHAGPECREKLIVFNERRGRVTTAWGSSGPSGAVAQMDHG